MLRIDIPPAGVPILNRTFDEYAIPAPPSGTDTEVNGDLILLFTDEEEAVDYLDQLESHSADLGNNAPEKPIINYLITAINNDEFVQAYLQ